MNVNSYLPSFAHQALQHVFRLRELAGVPREVAFSICVLDVQPYEVIGDVVLIEALIDVFDIFLIVVVPATLMIRQRGQRRKRLSA